MTSATYNESFQLSIIPVIVNFIQDLVTISSC